MQKKQYDSAFKKVVALESNVAFLQKAYKNCE